MSLKCGIVGLPNVGKSTLFNAITKTSVAEAANYPFCTIEPNSALAPMADSRLKELAKMYGSEKTIFSFLELTDIAGLVRGASAGEGLGNLFLSHIREVDAIIHMVRAFESEDILHVESTPNPLRDIKIIEEELILADTAHVESMLAKASKKSQSDKESQERVSIMKEVHKVLLEGKPASTAGSSPEAAAAIRALGLITTKPFIYVANVDEGGIASSKMSTEVAQYAQSTQSGFVSVCSTLELEASALEDEEREELLEAYGLSASGVSAIIRECFQALGLITYFTAGPKEARAWLVKSGASAPEAAGVIHSDFQKGFIRAEVISYDDIIKYGGEAQVKSAGRLRSEGKEYIVQDADVIHFRFNV